MLRQIAHINFPAPRGVNVNMMPIIHGDPDSVPVELRGYLPLAEHCNFAQGSTVYLTVSESFVQAGDTQRRSGVHVEAPRAFGWGGGNWGGTKQGLYMASSDGACRAWDCLRFDGDAHGGLTEPSQDAVALLPGTLYWLTDRTPHEALPSEKSCMRQFFRLVSEDVGGWWREHNTPNPLGVPPRAPIIEGSKYVELGGEK